MASLDSHLNELECKFSIILDRVFHYSNQVKARHLCHFGVGKRPRSSLVLDCLDFQPQMLTICGERYPNDVFKQFVERRSLNKQLMVWSFLTQCQTDPKTE